MRALGIRDPRVIPKLSQDGTITPTINFGSLDSLVSEIVEARTILNVRLGTLAAAHWQALAMLSVAPGGSLIEFLCIEPPPAASANNRLFESGLAPTAPFVPIQGEVPYSIGGQAALNVFFLSADSVGATPNGITLGGSRSTSSLWPPTPTRQGFLFERIWIPPGWHFWITLLGPTTEDTYVAWRTREIPQQQGAP